LRNFGIAKHQLIKRQAADCDCLGEFRAAQNARQFCKQYAAGKDLYLSGLRRIDQLRRCSIP
jgi:hypothetical protein